MEAALSTVMFEVEVPLTPVLAHMELTGIPIYLQHLQRLHDHFRERRIALRSLLQRMLYRLR